MESCDHKVYVIIISNCVRVQYKVGFDVNYDIGNNSIEHLS